MEWERQEGILLHAIPYLGHRILKVFTPYRGLLTLMARHVRVKDAALTSAFCRAEWVYRLRARSQIHPLGEAALIDSMTHLRERYDTVMAAGSIAHDLIRSQWPQEAARLLYDLLSASFHHLPRNPMAIAQSFRLKLLQFEGVLHLSPACMRCSARATHLSGGESLCATHAEAGSIAFDEMEWRLLLQLGLGRRFSDFDALTPTELFREKTERLWSCLTIN